MTWQRALGWRFGLLVLAVLLRVVIGVLGFMLGNLFALAVGFAFGWFAALAARE